MGRVLDVDYARQRKATPKVGQSQTSSYVASMWLCGVCGGGSQTRLDGSKTVPTKQHQLGLNSQRVALEEIFFLSTPARSSVARSRARFPAPALAAFCSWRVRPHQASCAL